MERILLRELPFAVAAQAKFHFSSLHVMVTKQIIFRLANSHSLRTHCLMLKMTDLKVKITEV